MLIVEELTPSAGTMLGAADIVKPHEIVVDACAAFAQSWGFPALSTALTRN